MGYLGDGLHPSPVDNALSRLFLNRLALKGRYTFALGKALRTYTMPLYNPMNKNLPKNPYFCMFFVQACLVR